MMSSSALLFEQRGNLPAQFLQQRGGKARFRQGDLRKLQRIGHAPDAIDLLHQLVLALDRRVIDFLGGAEHILDDLEDIRVGRQGEHQHHHAANARRDDELVGRMVQMGKQPAIEGGLALLAEAQHQIQFGTRLEGHESAQELDIVGRHRHVDHEIGARQREQHADKAGCQAGCNRGRVFRRHHGARAPQRGTPAGH